jgi:hypothetical protein
MTHDRRLEILEREHLAYRTFRRGLRRLRDAELIIMEALAILERDDHPLGPINKKANGVNETTAEREGFSKAQIAEMQKSLEENGK